MSDFQEFPKIARLSREVIVTEKIDGTNGQIYITEAGDMLVGSRTRWITPKQDNFGFARWCHENRDELMKLDPGRHFGEWWGKGIQRGYGVPDKRFSLFNVSRWNTVNVPACCCTVPVLWRGIFDTAAIMGALDDLAKNGSRAAPGFMQPEGIVVFHTQGNVGFKKTILKDEEHKSQQKVA